MSFLEKLATQGIIKARQISEIVRQAKEKYNNDIDESLLSFGVDEQVLLKAKGEYYNIPIKVVDLDSISTNTLKYVPEDSVDHYKFCPIGLKEGVLEVGIIEPENIQAMDALQFISAKLNLPFQVFLISKSDFKSIYKKYKGISGEVDQALSDFDIGKKVSEKDGFEIESKNIQGNLNLEEEKKIVEEAPIIKIVGVIFRHATEGGASDIHIENTGEKVKVRFRVDGILHTSLFLPLNVYNGVVARIKILAQLRLDEKRKPQDGGFSAKLDGKKIDFRVSTFPTTYGEKVVMRILDSTRGVKKLEELSLSKRNLSLIQGAIKRPFGLILVTGPTGSGKTTTLYSMLNELDREKKNVVSLEDPIEYHIPNMSQSEVMPEIGYTFASGLRSILRQDPDIIMVGEIRDKETAELAIHAALTGHLVFATLHTNNATGVIPRLIDMGIDPYLIAPTLRLAIAQRLAREVCPSSLKEVPINESTQAMIDSQFSDLPSDFKEEIESLEKMYEIVPSSECPSGTRGRVAIFEMFEMNEKIEKIILVNPVETEIYKIARDQGMITMREDAILKGLKGQIPIQEAFGF